MATRGPPPATIFNHLLMRSTFLHPSLRSADARERQHWKEFAVNFSEAAARRRYGAAAVWIVWLLVGGARAQTDEIQVYDATINAPGQFSVQLHNNYTPIGRKQPDFAGGIVPNHTLNGVPEWAYGLTDWLELGAYVPLYSWTSGRFQIDGAKLRAEFVVPHAQQRQFFYGINFELSFNAKQWEPTHNSGEIRPILGIRTGPVDLIVNPILDTSFQGGLGSLDFAPAARGAYNFSKNWAAALEYYGDYRRLRRFEPLNRQQQTLFAVVDYNAEPVSVEFGIGHGFTMASDALVLKMILSYDF
jgi:hypothetical protein